MTLTFHIPRRFAPSHSRLGRWLRRRTGDRLQAEALYIVVVTGLLLAGVLGSFLAWALLHASILADPTGPTALAYAITHLMAAGIGFFTVGWGFRPAITLTAGPGGLHIQQGARSVTLAPEHITAAETVDPVRYYRHERRYAATQDFVNHPERDVLLLRTARGAVVAVGLAAPDRAALVAWLDRTPALVTDHD